MIRMHYANCATFNADFDGDEINLHLPQACVSETVHATPFAGMRVLVAEKLMVPLVRAASLIATLEAFMQQGNED